MHVVWAMMWSDSAVNCRSNVEQIISSKTKASLLPPLECGGLGWNSFEASWQSLQYLFLMLGVSRPQIEMYRKSSWSVVWNDISRGRILDVSGNPFPETDTIAIYVRLMLSVYTRMRKCIEAWSLIPRPSIRFAAANHSAGQITYSQTTTSQSPAHGRLCHPEASP